MMTNFRTLSTRCFSLLRTNIPRISNSRLVSKRFFVKQANENKLLTKYLTRICGTCVACGISGYCLNNFYKSKRLKVHAVEKPNIHPYNFLADLVENAQPAVVYIEVSVRHPFANTFVKSHGSGFIVRPDGLILTNAHVVNRQDTVSVKLQDGRICEGKVQAVDNVTDLATVKINEKNLPTLQLGKSSAARPGEFVIAMGSPMNLNNSVTHGIISSVNRGSFELGMHNRDMEYIQTDATITKGNSGGPLVNLNGEAIGINTLHMMSGISFAIPSDRAIEFLKKAEQLEKKVSWRGRVRQSVRKGHYLGITMFTLTPDLLSDLQTRVVNFPKNITAGVLVHTVLIGSAAHRAGIQPGDVIVKINKQDIKSASDVYKLVESGDTLTVEVVSQNQKRTFTVKPDEVD